MLSIGGPFLWVGSPFLWLGSPFYGSVLCEGAKSRIHRPVPRNTTPTVWKMICRSVPNDMIRA
jgi:hypothetical protein